MLKPSGGAISHPCAARHCDRRNGNGLLLVQMLLRSARSEALCFLSACFTAIIRAWILRDSPHVHVEISSLSLSPHAHVHVHVHVHVEISSGVFLPLVMLGTGSLSSTEQDCLTWLDAGGQGIDTGLIYPDSARRCIRLAAAKVKRSRLFISNKVPCLKGLSSTAISRMYSDPSLNVPSGILDRDIQMSFDSINVSYVDLMLLHQPCRTLQDTILAYSSLEKLFKAGKARAIGISNVYDAAYLHDFVQQVPIRPAVLQNSFSLNTHDKAMLTACRKNGITFQSYSPLDGFRGGLQGIVRKHPLIPNISKANNLMPAQVAIRWVIQTGVPVVTSSRSLVHDIADLRAAQIQLTSEEMRQLNSF